MRMIQLSTHEQEAQIMKKKPLIIILLLAVSIATTLFLFYGVENDIPKPRGYFRIDFPEKAYRNYDSKCSVSFDIPEYSKVELFKDRISEDSCWFNIYFPKMNARVHCTYVPVGSEFDNLIHDSYGFAAKHEMKASGLRRTMIADTSRKVYGIIYDIEGDAASQLQFFLTDSTKHFFRGSLYFYNSPNADSIAPVLSFLRDDIIHLTETLHWQ